MSTFTDGDHYSAKSAADLSTKKGYVVKLDASNNVVLATAATDAILGVLADGGRQIKDNVDVVLINGVGTYKAIAGGTIAKDDYLTTNASGQVIATTTTGNKVLGRAMYAAVSGQQVEYLKQDFKY